MTGLPRGTDEAAEPTGVAAPDERLDLLIDAFCAAAGHELGGPLNGLGLLFQLVRRRIESGAHLEPEWLLETMTQGQALVRRMDRSVGSMLKLAQPRRGEGLPARGADLREIALHCVGLMREDLDRAGCGCRVLAPEALPGPWDADLVEVILLNLLSNAVRHGAGTAITVEVSRFPDAAVLAVSDEGPGVLARERARIFEKFFRGEVGLQTSGLGLGLWIVKSFTERLRGTVAIDPAVERGARFVVQLPLPPPGTGG